MAFTAHLSASCDRRRRRVSPVKAKLDSLTASFVRRQRMPRCWLAWEQPFFSGRSLGGAGHAVMKMGCAIEIIEKQMLALQGCGRLRQLGERVLPAINAPRHSIPCCPVGSMGRYRATWCVLPVDGLLFVDARVVAMHHGVSLPGHCRVCARLPCMPGVGQRLSHHDQRPS